VNNEKGLFYIFILQTIKKLVSLIVICNNRMQKIFRRYGGNGAGGIIFGIAGNNIISGKTFAHGVLDGILEIIPVHIKRLIDVAVGYRSRLEDRKKGFKGFFRGLLAKIIFGEEKNIGYGLRGNVTGNLVTFC